MNINTGDRVRCVTRDQGRLASSRVKEFFGRVEFVSGEMAMSNGGSYRKVRVVLEPSLINTRTFYTDSDLIEVIG